MKRCVHSIVLALFTLNCSLAQVSVDRPVVLESADPSLRQVTGLPQGSSPLSVLSAGVDQHGVHRLAATSAMGSTWLAELPGIATDAAPGLQMIVTVPALAAGDVSLSLNGGPAYPVILAPGRPLAGDAYPDGTLLSLVFDGAQFQVMNGLASLRRECPTGMVAVNDQFCVEPDERAAADFFNSNLACAQVDRRLCTWAELYVACTAAAQLGLSNMTNDWEWSNNTANEDGGVRVALLSTCAAAGVRDGFDTSIPVRSRCCYSR